MNELRANRLRAPQIAPKSIADIETVKRITRLQGKFRIWKILQITLPGTERASRIGIDPIANLLCANLYRRTQAEYDQQHEIRNGEF